jgi:hypothetical protein
MSKKHFVMLAAIIAEVSDMGTRNGLCIDIGNICKELNSNFNWTVWKKACNAAF